MAQKKNLLLSFSAVFVLIFSVFLINYPPRKAKSAPVIVTCDSGTPLDQTALDALEDLDVQFSPGAGDDVCIFQGTLSAHSVVVDSGVTLTHDAEGFDRGDGFYTGIEIATIEDFTLDGDINVDGKGCIDVAADDEGYGPDENNVCTYQTAGWGDGYHWTHGVQGGGHGGQGGIGTYASANAGGRTYDSSISPTLFGSTGGSDNQNTKGGSGGGAIKLSIGGTFIHNGTISADGEDGYISSTNVAGGGGAGGSVYITAEVLAGSTGTISVDGGAGGNNTTADGGGGGGGRIALIYESSIFSGLGAEDLNAPGGSGPDAAIDGNNGTVYVKDSTANDITIYHGFTYDSDFSVNSWTVDSSAEGQYCDGTDATPSITAVEEINLSGELDCTNSAIEGFNLSSGTEVTMTDFEFMMNGTTSVAPYTIITWTMDDAIPVSIENSDINSNIQWTNLSSLSIDADSSINANELGCQTYTTHDHGYGPDSSNICLYQTAGWGYGYQWSHGLQGAGHGGEGGVGKYASGSAGGNTYDSESEPVLIGSSGGMDNANTRGGYGGGLIRLDTTGDFTFNGSLSADGGDGLISSTNISGGGGSGGSIYITAGNIYGATGSLSANGGDGGDNETTDGGGGGGGRISVAGIDQTDLDYLSSLLPGDVAPGGSGNELGQNGSTGTFYTLFYSEPDQPILTAEDTSRNMGLSSSAYSSDGATHTSTDWRVCSNGSCDIDTLVWSKNGDTSNLESITVNADYGTFSGDLAGKNKLAPNTNYQIYVRHNNAAGDSGWSIATGQTTVANNSPATPTNSSPTDAATDQSKNPTLISSSYSDPDSDEHDSTNWIIWESSDCSGDSIWESDHDFTNLESILISAGTFAEDHLGQTELKSHTQYSWSNHYQDEYNGVSFDSVCTSFTTLNTTPTADAGTDQTTTEGDEIILSGSSTDQDWNDTVTETWIESLDSSDACTLDGTTVTTSNRETNYACIFSLIANDGTVDSAADTMTINVTADNDAPTMGTIADIEIDEEEALAVAVSAADADTTLLTLAASTLPNGAVFTDNEDTTGNMQWTPTSDQSGTYDVTFSVSDGTNETTQQVTITVNDTIQDDEEGDDEDPESPDEGDINTIEDIGLISGSEKGPGIVTLYNNSNEELCSVQAWGQGGAVPTTVRFQDNYYVSVVKNRTGTTIHLYDLNCNLVEKKRLSPKLHPRNMITRNFLGKSTSQEIGVTSRRGSKVYGKIFRYNPTKDKWYLLRQKTFRPVPVDYTLKKTNKGNILLQKNNKTLHKWEI